MSTYKSPAAARLLGISYYRLMGMIRSDRVFPPRKDSSGDYIWAEADLRAVREALARGRRGKQASQPCPSPEASEGRP
jgi:hypothetical protein